MPQVFRAWALTFASDIAANHSEGTFTATVTPVPEPVSLVLLGSGVAALAGRSRFPAQVTSPRQKTRH